MRGTGRAGIRLNELGTRRFALVRPYNVFETFRFGRMGAADPTIRLDTHCAQKSLWINGTPHRLSISVSEGYIEVQEWGTNPITDTRLRRFLGLHKAPLTVGGHAVLDTLARKHKNIHLSESLSLTHDLIRTVMQQLIEWKDAASAWRRWVHAHGTEIHGSGGLRLPPSPLATRGDVGRSLHGFGISQQRVGLIREIARLDQRIPRWAEESTTDLRRRLLSIPRLGQWTVDHFLGFSLNAPDAVPLGDFQLPHTVAWALENVSQSDDTRMLELLEPWNGERWYVLRILFAANIRSPRRGPRMNLGQASRPRPRP